MKIIIESADEEELAQVADEIGWLLNAGEGFAYSVKCVGINHVWTRPHAEAKGHVVIEVKRSRDTVG